MIVGAPEDDNVYQHRVGIEKAGAVYRCQTETPFGCEQIPFDLSGELNTQLHNADTYIVSHNLYSEIILVFSL